MKKYIKPSIREVEIELQNIMAGSTLSLEVNNDTYADPDYNVKSKSFDDDDDYDF